MDGKEKVIEDFVYYLRAGYPFFYVSTYEMNRCINLLSVAAAEHTNASGDQPYLPVVWDIQSNPQDPEAILEEIDSAIEGSVYFLKNFNWFLKDDFGKPNKQIITTLQNTMLKYSKGEERKAIVIVSDEPAEEALPAAILRDFLPLDFDLPGVEEIGVELDKTIEIAKKAKSKFKAPTAKERERLIDAALGLPLAEVTNAYAFCLVKKGKFDPRVIDRIKARMVEKVSGVYYKEYDSTFDKIMGLNNLKPYAAKTAHHPLAKGILLVGPPGTCKTRFGEAMSYETGMRMLTVEMAEFQGGIVGETERKVRDAIAIIRAMAGTVGVIVLLDEMEKGLKGAGGGAQTSTSDNITARAMGQWLKFMSDPGCKVYFVATCNDISGIPPEYIRAGRFDTAPFFVDLPNKEEQKVILDYYKGVYKVEGKVNGSMEGWSGAEIEAVCRIAVMMETTVDKAKRYIVPISKTMGKNIKALRDWAKDNCLPATIPLEIGDKARAIDM